MASFDDPDMDIFNLYDIFNDNEDEDIGGENETNEPRKPQKMLKT